jgi:signal transduction histidine kinase
MHRLRNRLIAAFLVATVLPLAATFWITMSLLDRSLGYATTGELDRLSRTLEATVRQFYQRERDALKEDAVAGRATPVLYRVGDAAAWPDAVRAFWDSGEVERFGVSGSAGDHVEYMRRSDGPGGTHPGVAAYRRDLGGIRMDQLTAELRQTRQLVESIDSRDLRRGFTLTLLLLLGATWIAGLVPLILIAHRISRPIQQLTAALTDFADGDWSRRLGRRGSHPRSTSGVTPEVDEVGRAVDAFNRMADQLQQSRERLVHLTRMASWQSLARKTAHELKNSLTPIRLTVEEMQARQPVDRAFMDQAVQIVVSEIESLERRVRAFSEFSSEPPVDREVLDVNALVTERVSLLRPVHPETSYHLRLDARNPRAHAGADLVKGILTNLLQNAAEAAGPGGSVLAVTTADDRQVAIEVHDSGPGLSVDASATLFEPTITFKKHGMGLGLSIARSHALLSGGDIALVRGELGGAAFRVTLPSYVPQRSGAAGLPPSREALRRDSPKPGRSDKPGEGGQTGGPVTDAAS